jgi:hypothetical protein
MVMGPVEYVVVGFPGNNFTAEIAPELAKLIDDKTVRVLDLLFIAKDAEGTVVHTEFDQLDELQAFAELDGEVGGLITSEDIAHVGALLEPDSAVALLVWEDLWAVPLVEAIRRAGGELLEGARIPRELVEEAFADIA